MMSLSHLASGAVWSTAAKFLQLLVTLLTLAIVGRYAGPEAFGVFSLVWVVIGLVEQTLISATVDGVVGQRRINPSHYSSLFWILLLVSVVAAGVVGLNASALAAWLGGGVTLASLLVCRALFTPLVSLCAPSLAMLTRDGQFKTLARIDMAANVLSACAGMSLALAGFGVWSLLAIDLIRLALQTGLQMAAARWLPSRVFSGDSLFELAPNSLQSIGSSLASLMIRTAPRLAIGHTLGSEALGYYAMAERLVEQIRRILVLPGYEIVKIGASRARDDLRAMRQLLWGAVSASSLLAYPVLMGGAAVSAVLVPFVLGPQWQPAVPALQIMLIASLRAPLSAYFTAILVGTGQAGKHNLLQAAQLTLTVLICLLVTPYGLNALCLALLARNAIYWMLGALMMKQVIEASVPAQASAGGRHLLASLVMAAGVLAWTLWTLPVLPASLCLAGGITLGAVLYLPALALLAPASWSAVGQVAARIARGERGAFKAYFVTVGAHTPNKA